MASSDATKDSLTSSVDPKKEEELTKDFFPYDSDVTDFTLIVEGRELHVAKVVLIDASPVFRKMLTGEFKEKTMSELELPGKEYSRFVPFLRCIFPREELTLTETCIDDILPIADEYEVNCVLQKCENWLLTELKFKGAKVTPHYVDVDNDMKYLMKCLYYGEKYSLQELYKKCFKTVLPYQLKWYIKNEHYQKLLEENKRKLLEARLERIERNVNKRLNVQNYYNSESEYDSDLHIKTSRSLPVRKKTYECSADLFQ